MDWPLTGRAEEIALLNSLIAGDADQAGIAVIGPAGVGKSRIAREAAATAAAQRWIVRSVEGTAAAQEIPLGAFAQWIDQRDAQPLHLISAVIASITESDSDTSVLVTVDDAHLLDSLSAFVVHQLVRRRAATVIATLRSGEPVSDSLTELWKDGDLRRHDLGPLTRPECDSLLVAALAGPVNEACAQRFWELTQGNALFLRQLVQQEFDAGRLSRDADGCWQAGAPVTVSATLADLVGVNISGVPEQVIEVLDLLAVAEPLEIECLTALAESAAMEDAERRDLIRVSRDGSTELVRIGHPLYGETRRARMGRLRSRRLRGQVAQAMKELSARAGGNAVDPVRLGLLWLESDLPGDVGILYRAAAVAFRRFDVALSGRLAEAAARSGAFAESAVLQARTLVMLGQADAAEQLLRSIPRESASDSLWASAIILRGLNLLFAQEDPELSWTVIDDALRVAPDSVMDQLLAFRGLQLAMAARPADLIALEESIDHARLDADARINLNFGVTIALGDLGCPHRATQAPEDWAVLSSDTPVVAYQAVALALIHADTLVTNGCIKEAITVGTRLGKTWADLPQIPQFIATAVNGVVAMRHGDLDTARPLLSAALIRPELLRLGGGIPYLGVGYWLCVTYTEALARAGQIDAALAQESCMQRNRHPAFEFLEPNHMLSRAWVAAARGRTSEAVVFSGEAAAFARAHGQPAREVLALQTALQFGDNSHRERLDELVELVEGPRAGLVARWAWAHLAKDGDALMQVSEDLEAMGDRIAAADAAAHAAHAFEFANRRGSKLTAGTRATRLITECGATTPATRQVSAPLPLTAREREIAAFVRDGLSNREIAETLTMSVRTVELHVYRACNKLGMANRAELAELMRQLAG